MVIGCIQESETSVGKDVKKKKRKLSFTSNRNAN